MYYCKSRYYSPLLCRFISPDSIRFLKPTKMNEMNLFSYCANNPIMYFDPSGYGFLLALSISFVIGAIVGGAVGAVTATANDQDVAAGFMIGFISGGLMGLSAFVAGLFIIPALAGSVVAIGGITLSASTALLYGTCISFGSGFLIGMITDMAIQEVNEGYVYDFESSIASGLQWGILNTVGVFFGALGGPSSASPSPMLDDGILSFFGTFISSLIGLAIDAIRNYEDEKDEKENSNSLISSFA